MNRNFLDGGEYRNIPEMWCRWKHLPDPGTIVHILATGLFASGELGEFDILPGGFFAEVYEKGFSNTEGQIWVLTLPVSLGDRQTSDSTFDWAQPYEIFLRGSAWDAASVRLEVVPDDVQDTVRAFMALKDWEQGQQPIVVDDGWLC